MARESVWGVLILAAIAYAFMLPNVTRRALDVFLAFRIPNPRNLKDKLSALCNGNPDFIDRPPAPQAQRA